MHQSWIIFLIFLSVFIFSYTYWQNVALHSISQTLVSLTSFQQLSPNINSTSDEQGQSADHFIQSSIFSPIMQFQKKYDRGFWKKLYATNNFKKSKWILPEPKADLKLNSTKILIAAGWRTGSTFTSELFNRHPDVFYQFEPLLPISGVNSATSIQQRKEVLQYLNQFYHKCQLHQDRKKKPDGLYFRFKNAWMMRPPFCVERFDLNYVSGKRDSTYDKKKCVYLNQYFWKMNQVCHSYQYLASNGWMGVEIGSNSP